MMNSPDSPQLVGTLDDAERVEDVVVIICSSRQKQLLIHVVAVRLTCD